MIALIVGSLFMLITVSLIAGCLGAAGEETRRQREREMIREYSMRGRESETVNG
jgi:hypothetical protein